MQHGTGAYLVAYESHSSGAPFEFSSFELDLPVPSHCLYALENFEHPLQISFVLHNPCLGTLFMQSLSLTSN